MNSAYDDYIFCMSEYVPWIKDQINKSEQGFIRVRRTELTTEFFNRLYAIGHKIKTDQTLYDIMRTILFEEDIFLQKDRHKGEKTFLLRKKKDGDELTQYLINNREEFKRNKSRRRSPIKLY